MEQFGGAVAVDLGEKDVLLQILLGLHHVFRLAEIAPIIFVGPKGKDSLALGGKAQVGRDDGESAYFSHHCKKTVGNYMDAGESQRLHVP